MINDIKRIKSEVTFSEPTPITINEFFFTFLAYQSVATDGMTYYYEAYYTATKDHGFEMYYVANENEFEVYQETLEQIAFSFEFIQ